MPDPTLLEQSLEIAREHVSWARRRGWTAAAILLAVDEPVPEWVWQDYDYAVLAVARQWREMQAGDGLLCGWPAGKPAGKGV
jgi:hypothetical protein